MQTAYGSNNLAGAQQHWQQHGCHENRSNQCPAPQSMSGAFTFQGCFKDQGSRAIPIQKQNVQNVDQCRQIADRFNKNVFGVQYYGQCFIGDNIEDAKKYGMLTNKDQCGNMGKSWTNQVYAKDDPIPQPPPPIPELSKSNFAEHFNNTESDDMLDKGFNNLYNQIYCDLWPKNDGFHTCNDCTLTGAKKIWKTTTENSPNSCKNNCKNDPRCTSYNFDRKIHKNNCNQYLDFPTEIQENVKDKNAGFKLNYRFDYNNLSTNQKKNVKEKCTTQLLNNYAKGEGINYSPCVKFSENNSSTLLNLDPKCTYELLEKKGMHKIKNIDNYESDSYIKPHRDPEIDNYEKMYKKYNAIQEENSQVNNELSKDDHTYVEYNDTVDEKNNELAQVYSDTISNLTAKQTDRTNLLLGVINNSSTEHFSNNNENSSKFFIFMLFIIFLIILFIYFRK